jgi:cysteine sulfinate desulfinase/cysteine desulfurase-like protein
MVYLDYAATCPVVKYPQQLYRNALGEGYFFNPNTNYAYKEKHLLSEAENRVKKAIGAKGDNQPQYIYPKLFQYHQRYKMGYTPYHAYY